MTTELLQLSFRWTHVVAGVLWIGSTYALAWGLPRWPQGSAELAGWLRYGALLTWLSGASLLLLLYYSGSYPYLLEDGARPNAADWLPLFAGLFAGVPIYEAALRLAPSRAGPGRGLVGGLLRALAPLLLLAASLGFAHWLELRGCSRRALHVHAGAFLATGLLASVWFGLARDPGLAALRLRHVARISIPLLLLMVSADQPVLTGYDPWRLSLGAVLLGGYAMGLLIERGIEFGPPVDG